MPEPIRDVFTQELYKRGLVDETGAPAGTSTTLGPFAVRAPFAGRRNVGQSVTWQQSGLSNGTDLSKTYRMGFVVEDRTCDMVLVFANAITASTGQTGVGNPITVTAGFEYNGATYPITFGGQTSVVIPDGKWVACDPIPVDLPAGATYYVRSCPTVTSGQKWNTGILGWNTCTVSAANVDLTTGTGALANPLSGQSFELRAFGPVAALGSTQSGVKSTVFLTDSIGAGTGDGTPSRNVAARGFVVRGLGFTGTWMHQGIPSSQAATRALQSTQPLFNALYSNNDDAICNLGTNDLASGATVATVQANWLTIWGYFFNRGIPIWHCTMPPKTTSTDRFATAANQSVTSTTENNSRIALNDWLRDGAPISSAWAPQPVGTVGVLRAGSPGHPLSGYIETADTVEVDASGAPTRNGGRWAAYGVSDSGTFTAWANSPYMATDSAKSWAVNEHAGKICHITAGTGAGQRMGIVSNTATGLVFNAAPTAPDATSQYVIVDSTTDDGTHPGINGHIRLSAPVATWKSQRT